MVLHTDIFEWGLKVWWLSWRLYWYNQLIILCPFCSQLCLDEFYAPSLGSVNNVINCFLELFWLTVQFFPHCMSQATVCKLSVNTRQSNDLQCSSESFKVTKQTSRQQACCQTDRSTQKINFLKRENPKPSFIWDYFRATKIVSDCHVR